jgi:hypothetical protein
VHERGMLGTLLPLLFPLSLKRLPSPDEGVVMLERMSVIFWGVGADSTVTLRAARVKVAKDVVFMLAVLCDGMEHKADDRIDEML